MMPESNNHQQNRGRSWQPGCPVMSCPVLSRLPYPGRPTSIVLSRLSCLGCPLSVVLSQLSCLGCPFSAVLSRLSFLGCPFSAVLPRLFFLGCPFSAVLSRVSCPRCLSPVSPSQMSCHGSPVPLSCNFYNAPAILTQLSCPVYVPSCHVLVILSSLSACPVPGVLPFCLDIMFLPSFPICSDDSLSSTAAGKLCSFVMFSGNFGRSLYYRYLKQQQNEKFV
jgi:hypothetical protein